MNELTSGSEDRRHMPAHHVGQTRTLIGRFMFQRPDHWSLKVVLSGGGIAS
jgi:hypothetical protein